MRVGGQHRRPLGTGRYRRRRAERRGAAVLLTGLLVAAAPARAQPDDAAGSAEEVVAYPVTFFDRYRPNTALDMVNQLPGFQLDNGDVQRGFGGTSGNLLINGRYPSAKQDTPSGILARIPAEQVDRIELIRGQTGEIDLRGRGVVANVVLVDDIGAAVSWDFAVRRNFRFSPLAPVGGISVSSRWRGVDYNAGVDGRRAAYGDPGEELLLDSSDTVIERRTDDSWGSGFNLNAYLTAAALLGETRVKLNTTLRHLLRNEELRTTHIPVAPGGERGEDLFLTRRDDRTLEIGIDAERYLNPEFLGTVILLYQQLDRQPWSSQRSFDADGNEFLFRRADSGIEERESIARLELDWTPSPDHVIQFNVEGAHNTLDGSLVQIVDTGSGPEIVPVPGANTRVEEMRGDVLLNDTWTLGDFELDYGLGAEASTISQSGDAELERSFFFWKPRAALTYVASENRQSRLQIAREVSQLDFNDFVSATEFQDDDLALGNPDLKPESTWTAELSEERRFGELSVVKVTAFHHWISDVEDLLPLTDVFEVPGNIGDGRRWGLELETTLPLDRVGLSGARIDVKARWQDSTVTDPVTGNARVLTADGGHQGPVGLDGENRYALSVAFRQDFDEAQLSWGWDVAERAERPQFKVNELDVYDEDSDVNVFVETTRWFGIKTRLSALNVLDRDQDRDRRVYEARRGLSPVAFRELRKLNNGVRLLLTLSGTF